MKKIWENINKVNAQVIACMIIIMCVFVLSFYALIVGMPKESEIFINKVVDVSLMGVIGWLFTNNKNGNEKKDES